MPRSKSDIANAAIRMFLQEVGRFYDRARGFEEYKSTKAHKRELLDFFDYQCCYCHREIGFESLSEDHLVPINKVALGLHCWGNVVPSCKECNEAKHLKRWEVHLEFIWGNDLVTLEECRQKILAFLDQYRYRPDLHLQGIAANLYEDVGEVASTLIRLRLKQAEALIQKLQITEYDLSSGSGIIGKDP